MYLRIISKKSALELHPDRGNGVGGLVEYRDGREGAKIPWDIR